MRYGNVVLMLGVALVPSGFAPSFAGLIQRADLDGSNVEIVVQTESERNPGVAIDPLAGKVYWTSDSCPSSSKIQRADLDGSNVEVLVSGLDHAWAIALDVANQKMYWGGSTGCFFPVDLLPLIFRANLDGTDVERVVDTPWGLVFGIAVHSQQGKIYWTAQFDCTPCASISRANLDGSGSETLLWNLNDLKEIELDEANGGMYWIESYPGTVSRANLDGSNRTVLVAGLDRPEGIALDGAHVYWTATSDDRIERANLDGSDVETLVVVDRPGSIAIDQGAAKMYWIGPGETIPIPAVTGRGVVAAALLMLVVAAIALRRMT